MPKPRLTVFAGPNGSGKTTLYKRHAHKFDNPYINADEIASNERVSEIRAARLALTQRKSLILAKRSFVTETTLSGNSPLKLMRDAKDAGFEIDLWFISTSDPTINHDRIVQRTDLGGHGVRQQDVERRYARSIQNLETAIRSSHTTHLFNNDTRLQLVAIVKSHQVRINRSIQNVPNWVPETLKQRLEQELNHDTSGLGL